MKEEENPTLMQQDGGGPSVWRVGGKCVSVCVSGGRERDVIIGLLVAATETSESSYENEVLVIDWPVKFLFLRIDWRGSGQY